MSQSTRAVSARLSLKILASFASAMFAPVPEAHAQETTDLPEIFITADRFGIEQEKLGSASTVITREQLEDSGAVYIQDALRTVPGLAVNRGGSFGSLTQVRVRGAEGNHVVVVVDGIEMNNPVQGEFDFSNLLVDNIERIEVLRGPQSASWGSNALAGVINIVTRKGSKGVRATASAEAGTFDTQQLSGGLYAGTDRARMALSATRLRTDGINISDFGSEQDGDGNLTLSAKGDVDITRFFNIEGVFRHNKHDLDSDKQDFDFPATATQGLVLDADDVTKREESFGRVQGTLNLFGERWEQKVFYTGADTQSDTYQNGTRSSGNLGRRSHYGYQSVMRFDTPAFANAQHTLIGLVESETERFRNTAPTANAAQAQWFERELVGKVGEYRLGLWDSLFFTGAYRHDENDTFENAETYRATAAYLLRRTGTRLHGSIGKGVTNPTFTEQFGFNPNTFDGNPNLVPEVSRGWDAGIEQKFFDDRLTVDVTYFKADLENEIVGTFDNMTFRSSVDNLTEDSKREGVEVSLVAKPTRSLDIVGSYTYTDSVQVRNGVEQREVRRPEHMASLDVNYRFRNNRAQVGLGVVYNGDMDDLEFISATPETVVTLDNYTLVRLSGSYRINENVQWYGRVENVFDERYEEVFGFNTPGLGAYTGIRVKLGE